MMSKPLNPQNLSAADAFIRQLLLDRGLAIEKDGKLLDASTGNEAKQLQFPLVRLMLERGWRWETDAELAWLDRNWPRMVAFPDNVNFLQEFVISRVASPVHDIPPGLRASGAPIGETFGTLKGRLPRLRRIVEILTRNELISVSATGVYYDMATNSNIDDLVAILHVMPWQWDTSEDEEYLVRNWSVLVGALGRDFQQVAYFLVKFAAMSRIDVPEGLVDWAEDQ